MTTTLRLFDHGGRVARWTLPVSAGWLLCALVCGSANPFGRFNAGVTVVKTNQKLFDLPDRSRAATETLLAGWRSERDDANKHFNGYAPEPGCYTIAYTLHGDAKIWVMYSADGRRRLICENSD